MAEEITDGAFNSLSAGIQQWVRTMPKDTRERFTAALERARSSSDLIHVTPQPKCHICKDLGQVYAHPWRPGQTEPPPIVACTCQTGQEQRAQIRKAIIGGSGLQDFAEKTFANYPPRPGQEAYWEIGKDWAHTPFGWLWVNGYYATGKTTFAQCMGNLWLAEEMRVLYRDVPAMLRELREAMFSEDDKQAYQRQLHAVCQAPILILDDIAQENPTPFAREQVWTITSYRLERSLPTLVTTNLTMAQLREDYPRIYERVQNPGVCTTLTFTNPPIRTPAP